MRLTVMLAFLLVVRPMQPASAQPVSARDSSLAAFSRDMARLQRLVDSLTVESYGGSLPSVSRNQYALMARDWERMIKPMVDVAASIAARWKDDPYVAIDGFELAVALPPSVTIQFRFKESPSKPATFR